MAENCLLSRRRALGFGVSAVGLIFSRCGGGARPDDYTGMVELPGGEFEMGSEHGYPYEGPVHRVRVKPFYLDETELPNAKYAEFVDATSYRTESEKQGSSGVFNPAEGAWSLVDGADWRHPEGPQTSIDDRMDFPVVHVSWDDAAAYCEWAKKRLPTEAEYEFAARGGLPRSEFAWGDEFTPQGRYRANTWQGRFPERDMLEDGYGGVAPVKRYPANPYGLYDITGNVWEWVNDWFGADYYASSPTSDPRGPNEGTEKVQRGGSWLCAENFCQGYRVAARQKTARDSGLNNLGFRCAADV